MRELMHTLDKYFEEIALLIGVVVFIIGTVYIITYAVDRTHDQRKIEETNRSEERLALINTCKTLEVEDREPCMLHLAEEF